MRAYASHEDACRRMEEHRQQRGRLALEDLLRYLEDVSSEPSGEDAYRLAFSLRRMNLPVENLYALLHDTRDRLASCRNESGPHESIGPNLDKATRLLEGRLEHQRRHPTSPAVIAKQDGECDQAESSCNMPEDPELRAARDHGHEIGAHIRGHSKWRLFHNMAALAICWACLKPSRRSSPEALSWVEEDVQKMFP